MLLDSPDNFVKVALLFIEEIFTDLFISKKSFINFMFLNALKEKGSTTFENLPSSDKESSLSFTEHYSRYFSTNFSIFPEAHN